MARLMLRLRKTQLHILHTWYVIYVEYFVYIPGGENNMNRIDMKTFRQMVLDLQNHTIREVFKTLGANNLVEPEYFDAKLDKISQKLSERVGENFDINATLKHLVVSAELRAVRMFFEEDLPETDILLTVDMDSEDEVEGNKLIEWN